MLISTPALGKRKHHHHPHKHVKKAAKHQGYHLDKKKCRIRIIKKAGKLIEIDKHCNKTVIRGERKHPKVNLNRVHIFGGVGPSGKLNINTKTGEVKADKAAVVGIGYSRRLDKHLELGIMIFTNETYGGTITVGF